MKFPKGLLPSKVKTTQKPSREWRQLELADLKIGGQFFFLSEFQHAGPYRLISMSWITAKNGKPKLYLRGICFSQKIIGVNRVDATELCAEYSNLFYVEKNK